MISKASALPSVASFREEQRRITTRMISDAALKLFEEQGVANTSVEEIAEAASVSPRTFYRYAQTKENAVFIDDITMDTLLKRVEAAEQNMRSVLGAIEKEQLAILRDFDDATAEAQARSLQLRRLIFSEPALLSRALTREEEYVQELTALVLRASDTPAADELRARTTVTAISTTIRLTFDEWARHAEQGRHVTSRELYDQIRHGFSDYFAAISLRP